MDLRVFLNTTSPICEMIIRDGEKEYIFKDETDRDLAKNLLGVLISHLNSINKNIDDIAGIGVLRGPGSFTGIRIGMAVMNTIADDKNIPIVGEIGESWMENADIRLKSGENDKMILPFYDRPVNITKPRK